MLKILYGRAGAGKSTRIIENILELSDRGERSILIVPEHLSHETERILAHAGGDKNSLFSEVLSIKRLANRVFSLHGGIADRYLGTGARLALLRRAFHNVSGSLRAARAAHARPDRLKDFLALIDECKSCEISPEALSLLSESTEGALKDKLYDLSLIFAEYNSLLTKEAGDPGDLLGELTKILPETGFFKDTSVFIDGFTEFTRAEHRFIREIIRSARLLTVALTLDNPFLTDDEGGIFHGTRLSARSLTALAKREGVLHEFILIDENKRFRCQSLSHLEKNLFAEDSQKYNEPASIRIGAAADRLSECEWTAAEILRLCREKGFRYRDILVAVPDTSLYARTLEQVFSYYRIPLYMDNMDDVLRKPVISAAIAAAETVIGGFEREDFLKYLKSGLSGVPFDDACHLENYILLWNIRGKTLALNKEFTLNPFGFSAPNDECASAELEKLNDIRKRALYPLYRLKEGFAPPRGMLLTVRELSLAYWSFLEDIGFEGEITRRQEALLKAGELRLAAEYSQLYEILADAADRLVDALGDIPMRASEYLEFLKTCVSTETVGAIPVSLDRVSAGSVGRIRHRRARVLILLGAKEGEFPGVPRPSGFLSDEDREAVILGGLPISPGTEGRMYRELETAYAILSLPSERLIISCPEQGGGEISHLCRRILALFSSVLYERFDNPYRFFAALDPCLDFALKGIWEKGNLSAEIALDYFYRSGRKKEVLSLAKAASDPSRGALSEGGTASLYGAYVKLTASRSDSFHSCPFQYFMRYGLRAKTLNKAALDAMSSGSFLHYVLENALREAERLGGVGETDDRTLYELARRSADDYASEILGGAVYNNPRLRYLFSRVKRIGELAVKNAADELRRSKFSPIEFELGFGMGDKSELPPVMLPESGASLSGVIDRVDGYVAGDRLYLRVVDYKTGKKSFSLTDIYHGIGVQMFIYLFALCSAAKERYGREALPAGILYVPAREVLVSVPRHSGQEKIEEELEKALRRSGLVLADPEIICAMEEGSKKTFIPVGFKVDGNFTKVSSVATLSEFGQIKTHIDGLFRQMAREIRRGALEALPFFRSEAENACRFCDYAAACQFDESNGFDRPRRIAKIERDEFFKAILEGAK